MTDTGANFELGANKTFAVLTFVGSLVLTAVDLDSIFWECENEPRDSATPIGKVRALARRAAAASIG